MDNNPLRPVARGCKPSLTVRPYSSRLRPLFTPSAFNPRASIAQQVGKAFSRRIIAAAVAVLGWTGSARAASFGGMDPGAMLAQALTTGVVVGLLLLAWERLTRNRRLRQQLLRELRYYRNWSDDEGIQRKVGLLKELNDHGGEPKDLEGVVLNGADLKGLRMRGCLLRGAKLVNADLQGTELDGADLFGADLTGANLERATLNHANLRGAELEGANLVKTELAGANLHRANLVDANLHKANLRTASIHLARFTYRQTGLFQQSVHPSVEDWIRERLDGRGVYLEPGEDGKDGTVPSPEETD